MTPNATRGQLYCSRGMRDRAGHGRYVAVESGILPAVRAEAARLRIPFDEVEIGEGQAATLAALAERKRRLALTFSDGAIDEATYRAELGRIGAEAEAAESAVRIVKLPPLDWEAPRAAVNAVLRAMFERVELGPNMTVSRIVWRVPEWRA